MEQITSRDNPRIRQYVQLSADAKKRREAGKFVIEGMRLCSDALESGVSIDTLYFTENAAERYAAAVSRLTERARESFIVSDAAAARLSDTGHAQGIFCECAVLDKRLNIHKIENNSRLVVLEGIQDPANLGTVLRSAEAFGVDGVLLSEGCCDVYNPKVLRGSMGAVFRVPFAREADLAGVLRRWTDAGVLTLAAVVDRAATPVTKLEISGAAAIVIGNEGNGLTPEAAAACKERVTIPMRGRAESLNAAAAAAVLIWEMTRREG